MKLPKYLTLAQLAEVCRVFLPGFDPDFLAPTLWPVIAHARLSQSFYVPFVTSVVGDAAIEAEARQKIERLEAESVQITEALDYMDAVSFKKDTERLARIVEELAGIGEKTVLDLILEKFAISTFDHRKDVLLWKQEVRATKAWCKTNGYDETNGVLILFPHKRSGHIALAIPDHKNRKLIGVGSLPVCSSNSKFFKSVSGFVGKPEATNGVQYVETFDLEGWEEKRS